MTIINTIEQICKRDPLAGKTVTGGIVTVNDSKWQMSFTVNRQQQFKSQPEDEVSVWIYALYSNINGITSINLSLNAVEMKFAKNGYIIWAFLSIKLKTSLKRNVIRYQFICHISVLILCLDPLETDHLSCLKMLVIGNLQKQKEILYLPLNIR